MRVAAEFSVLCVTVGCAVNFCVKLLRQIQIDTSVPSAAAAALVVQTHFLGNKLSRNTLLIYCPQNVHLDLEAQIPSYNAVRTHPKHVRRTCLG